jgi:hypothetical protein
VAAGADLLLAQRQGLAGGDPELPLDQVQAGDRLRDRVLDLEAGVHLDEVEPAVGGEQELDRAGTLVGRGQRRLDGGAAERLAQARRQARGRRLLDHLLVAALERAVALEQVDRVPVAVGEHLDLDVARALDQALQQHPVVAEGGTRLAAAGGERLAERGQVVDPAHALAAAAGSGLDQQRRADPGGLVLERASDWSAPW